MASIQEQDKKKGGRPPTGRVRKLSKSVTVKFSKPSYEALRLRARKANHKLAEYIRESALNGEVASGHNAETVAIAKNLIGMANNLNQLTKLSHQRGSNIAGMIFSEQKLKTSHSKYTCNSCYKLCIRSLSIKIVKMHILKVHFGDIFYIFVMAKITWYKNAKQICTGRHSST